MTPEGKARQRIDEKLEQAGWVVQDLRQLDLGTARGVAIREYPTDTGPADYVLFVDREPVGVIEAKADATILTFVEEQTARYAASALKWRVKAAPLPFLFESNDQHMSLGPNDESASALLTHIHTERAARGATRPRRCCKMKEDA